jgi:hypothetical protein
MKHNKKSFFSRLKILMVVIVGGVRLGLVVVILNLKYD